jgi:hypothetical protein
VYKEMCVDVGTIIFVKKEVFMHSPPSPIIQMGSMSQSSATSDLQEEYKGNLSVPTSPYTLFALKVFVFSKSDFFYHWYWAVI